MLEGLIRLRVVGIMGLRASILEFRTCGSGFWGFSVRGSTSPTFLDVAIIHEAQSIIRSLTWSTGSLSGLCGGCPHLFWGSPTIRVLVFWGSILGSPFLGKLPCSGAPARVF